MSKITEHEAEVLEMMMGTRPWERGAWVNACYEFLVESGYATRAGEVTKKGEYRYIQYKLKDAPKL